MSQLFSGKDTPSSHLRCIPKPPAAAALTIGLYHLHALAETDKKVHCVVNQCVMDPNESEKR